MLKIKFKLCGKKQQPIYKLGLMLSTSSRNSNLGQNLGFYNTLTKELKFTISNFIWILKCGVQPSQTVKNLLIKKNILINKNILNNKNLLTNKNLLKVKLYKIKRPQLKS